MAQIDATHDPRRQSWVTSANGHPDFPIQNLPLGVFSPGGNTLRRGGVAIGDMVFDLRVAVEAGLFTGVARDAAEKASSWALNALLALGAEPRRALRQQLVDSLDMAAPGGAPSEDLYRRLLHPMAECVLHLPAHIGDYTDFYAGIHHATNVGKQFRPDNPLLPNYRYVPIGYHGRASSIVPSGTPIRRPLGQFKPADAAEPSFAPSRRLDYELELGIWIGPGNDLGDPIPIAEAERHIAGFCLLNDWSARDFQAWESQPLGPFLSKNFATTISPWIVTPEALAPFAMAQARRPQDDPLPLPYLLDRKDQRAGALDLELEVLLVTPEMRNTGQPPDRVARSHARHMYWTPGQLIAHHTSGGCNLRPGDLLGTGTISAPDPEGCGSLLEATKGGREPLRLATVEERRFLEDGDEVILRARAVSRSGFAQIGFGECRGMIIAAHPFPRSREEGAREASG